MSILITDIITRLLHLQTHSPDSIKRIRSFNQLIEALRELDSIVDMKEAKEAIGLQLQYIVVKLINLPPESSIDCIFEDHMLHTVISGPPGTGKTNLGKVLAKIWFALGILKGKRPHPEVPEPIYKEFVNKQNSVNTQLTKSLSSIEKSIYKVGSYISYYNDKHAQSIIKHLENHRKTIQTIVDNNKLASLEPTSQDPIPFFIATRAHFVGKYLGHTAPKTQALLESCVGGVLFVDEAYSLMNRADDSFGMEALTELNKFMSERPNELIVIFAGYKDLLNSTVFSAQPGLLSRFHWSFDIEAYTPTGLKFIFQKQLEKHGWSMNPNVDLIKFFTDHMNDFKSFGRDTERLAFCCKLYHTHSQFNILTEPKKRKAESEAEPVSNKRVKISNETSIDKSGLNQIIDENTLKLAFEKYRQNNNKITNNSKPPFGMYL